MKAIIAIALALSASVHAAPAVVAVEDAWVRPAVEGFKATLAFAKFTTDSDAQILTVSTPAAKKVELQKMDKNGIDVEMKVVDSIPLRSHEPLQLKLGPGNYQLMLQGIKRELRPGEKVPMTMTLMVPGNKAPTKFKFNAEVRLPKGYRTGGFTHQH